MFENMLGGLRHFRRSVTRMARLACGGRYRPVLEHLEDRWAPATITVNNVSDGVFNHNPAVLPSTLGPIVTLRDAITAANNDTANTGNTDTIVLLPGTYTLNNVDNTTLGANALPVITGNIIIEDAGSLPITLNVAGASMRLFDVEATGHLTLQSITLSGGTAQGQSGGQGFSGGGGAAGLGGAIFNQGTVSIFDCTLTANKAVGGTGGAVGAGNAGAGAGFAGGAGSTQNGVAGGNGGFGGGGGGGDSSVGGNGGFGGGAGGSNSTVGGSGGFGGGNAGAAAGAGGAGLGGAIFNDEGTLTLINSTITANSATAGASGTGGGGNPGAALGAGVFNYNATFDSFNDTIISNTLIGNASPQNAADVYNLGNGATDTQQGTVSQGAITVTLTFPTPGAQPNAIINTANLTGTSITATAVTATVGAAPLTDAVQTLSFGGNITGGWFTITLGGAGGPTTAPIAWTDSPTGLAANIRAAVSSLDATYAVTASQGGSADGFPDAVSATLVFSNPTALEADTTLVIGTTSVDGQGNFDNTLIGTYATAAALPVDGLQTVGFSGNITGGSFALGFTFVQGQPVIFTNNIAWSDNPAVLSASIQTAVNALFATFDNTDSVTVGAATVENLAFPTAGAQPSVTVNTQNLTGTPNAAIIDVADGALPDVNAGQAIEFTGGITGGTFTLTLTGANGAAGSDTTAPIAWESNPSTLAANIRFAIDNLVAGLSPSVAAGSSIDTITYPFPSHFTLVAIASGLTAGANGTPSVTISLNSNVATVTFGGDIVGGSFLLVDGAQSAPVAWSNDPATLAANLQTALNELAPTMTATDLSNDIIGQYVDQTINAGSNYSTGSNNLAVTNAVAVGGTLTFTTVANTAAMELGTLANNGGFTQTLELLDGSPAAVSGANLTDLFKTYGLGATDQRGVSRGAIWSAGAYQDSTPGLPASVTLVAGSAKAGVINKNYTTTLQVLVTDAFGNPVSGVTVTFNAPTTGASVIFSTPFVTVGATGKSTTAVHRGTRAVTGTTNSSGIATATLTANAKTGTFNITVTVNGIATPLTVSLTNLA